MRLCLPSPTRKLQGAEARIVHRIYLILFSWWSDLVFCAFFPRVLRLSKFHVKLIEALYSGVHHGPTVCAGNK